MPETTQIERLLKILVNLSSGIKYTADDIADRYEISRRTFFRDMNVLSNAGFAIEVEEGRYWIERMGTPFKDLQDLPYFTEEEAWILKRAIHSVDDNNQLKSNLVNKLYSLYKFGKVAEVIINRQQSDIVTNMSKAIRKKRQVILHAYHSANSNTIENRRVEPFNFTANFVAVWAYDTESQSCKTFKTARIKKVSIENQSFIYEEHHRSLPMDVFRISGESQIPVRLKLGMRAYNLIIEEYPLSEKYIKPMDEHHWLFDAPVNSFDGVGRFVLGLLEDIEVLKPDSLKIYLKEKINNYEIKFFQ